MAITHSQGLRAETPEQLAAVTERALLEIIRDNLKSQYGSQAAPLAKFRDAVSDHSAIEDDATLLADFRAHVPLSNYVSYKPFVDKFNVQPCKEEDVKDLFSPGLPDFFALSSATTGTTPKLVPKYNHAARLGRPTTQLFDPNSNVPLAAVVSNQARGFKEVERAPGEIVQKIPICLFTSGVLRRTLGWYTDDESWMSRRVPGYVVPLAATVISHRPSHLAIHGLFFLAYRDLEIFHLPFAPVFIDLIRHIDEQWDVLVSSIRDGTIPELEGLDDIRHYLQPHFRADPERAAELLEIGSPFSADGWFSRVWPKARELETMCSGQFATALPKTKSILGPNVHICSPGYGASEAVIAPQHEADKPDEFVLQCDDILEFLDVSQDESHENLRQAWEVEVGKQYEPVLTTRDGLWRYQLGDVLTIIGFDTKSFSPVFKFSGRRSLAIRLRTTHIADDQLLAAIQKFSSEDVIQVQEFTAVLDDRSLLQTIGFFIELAGPFGPNAHLAPQRLFEALVSTNAQHQYMLDHGYICLPTIRIVKTGTFAEYRRWKSETVKVASGQMKVPAVLQDPAAQKWILERVVHEL